MPRFLSEWKEWGFVFLNQFGEVRVSGMGFEIEHENG